MAKAYHGTRRQSSVDTSKETIERLLTHGVTDVIIREGLAAKLGTGTPLRIKLGVDPTAPDLHLGHAVILWKLREFQDAGHTVVLIIGDATARIGDPSGKSKVRPILSEREIRTNAQTYVQHVTRILTAKQTEVRRNSEWFDDLGFVDLITTAAQFTVARLVEREDFRARLSAGKDLHVHELLYPVMQAYDSIAVEADVEIGGTDQLFNMLAGRDLQRKRELPEQAVITCPLLIGTDGVEKMSKSLGNAIGITDEPDVMMGKLMSIPDTAILDYARLAARWSASRLADLERRFRQKENPRDLKLGVGESIVELYHGKTDASRAREEWLRVVHGGDVPKSVPTVRLRTGAWELAELLVAAKLATSKSDARRLVQQGGVRKNQSSVPVDAERIDVQSGDLLQVGKRSFVRVA